MKTRELRKYLKELGEDGEYTFLDKYRNTSRRLWQKMVDYPVDGTTVLRRKLHFLVETIFADCLTVKTGGWDD